MQKKRKEKKRKEKEREVIDNNTINKKSDRFEGEPSSLSNFAYGEFQNIVLTNKEFEKLKATYQDYKGLIDKTSAYLANAKRDYSNHYALLVKIAGEDGYVKRPRAKKPPDKEQKSNGVPCPEHIKQKISNATRKLGEKTEWSKKKN